MYRHYHYVKYKHYVKLMLGVALLAALLAGCGVTQSTQPTSGAQPTTQPTARPGATARPTIDSATAQPKPSAVPAATAKPRPTAAPSTPVPQPVIGFNPQSGGPGTVVDVFGSGYAPGQPVKLRLGLPSPTGEVLASAFPGADGSWSARLTIPDRLPSGDPITTKNMFLVAMDDANVALASAPFGFTPPQGPTLADARQTVRDLLNAWTHGNPEKIGGLLAKNLRDQVSPPATHTSRC